MITSMIAAGGIVINPKNEMLWIFRRGFWDLPKGKLEEGESVESCALREVAEETGLVHLKLKDLISITHHTYFDNYLHQEVNKETHWYWMTIEEEQTGNPQLEEDIEKIVWVKQEDLQYYLQNSYPTIQQLVPLFLSKKN